MTDTQSSGATAGISSDNYSIEMTARTWSHYGRPGTPSRRKRNLRYVLTGEDMPARMRRRHCQIVRPLPLSRDISARRLLSTRNLTTFSLVSKLRSGVERAFVVAGDPPKSARPFEDALA